MYPASLARALREAGVDAVAVDEHDPLKGLSDEELLTGASRDRRAIVTENVSDFMRLVGQWADADQDHSGVVIALSTRFSRTPAGHGELVEGLVELCADRPEEDALRDGVHFLGRGASPR